MTTIETSFFGDRISIICVSEWGYYVTQLYLQLSLTLLTL